MKKDKLLILLLIISMLVWGVTWSSAKVLSDYGNPLSVSYLRFLVTLLTLLPLLKILKIDIKVKKTGRWIVSVAGFLMALYGFVFFTGLQYGMAGSGGVLVTTLNPIYAFVLGLVLSKTLPSKFEFIGLLVGTLAGLVLLEVWENASSIFDKDNLYFVVGAFIWAVMSKVTSKGGDVAHPLSFNFWVQFFSVLAMNFFVDFSEVLAIIQKGDIYFWGNLLFFGMVNSAIATSCYFYATMELGAEKASTFLFLVPVGAVFSSWLFLGEPVEIHTLVGGALGILAVFIINKRVKVGGEHSN